MTKRRYIERTTAQAQDAQAEVAAVPSSMISPPLSPSPPAPTKRATLIAMLAQDGGATAEQMIAATGWLPHTLRAALSGLRKQGMVLNRIKRDSLTCYCIGDAA